MDKKTLGSWIVLPLLEDVDVLKDRSSIAEDIYQVFGDTAVFYLPTHTEAVRSKNISYALFDGYVFVNTSTCNNVDVATDILPYGLIGKPLKNGGKVECFPDAEISRFKGIAEERAFSFIPAIGDKVIARTGTFSGLVGEVNAVDKKSRVALVAFKMISRTVKAKVKFINLREYSDFIEDRRSQARASRGTNDYRMDL